MRCTDERLRILDAVISMKESFNVVAISDKLEESGFPVSLPTVYNNLKLLNHAGIISRGISNEGKGCFVPVRKEINRVKLICTSCGKIRLVDNANISAAILKRKYRGFTASTYLAYVEGLCTKCRNKLNELNQ